MRLVNQTGPCAYEQAMPLRICAAPWYWDCVAVATCSAATVSSADHGGGARNRQQIRPYIAVVPPSIEKTLPVMKAASSDAR